MRPGPHPTSAAERLGKHLRIDAATGCHIFTGGLSPKGYGRLTVGGLPPRIVFAHRVAYEAAKGAIPNGLQVDHLCRNRACCNPEHLEAVTSRENTLRGNGPCGINARRTHCKRGHPLEGENLLLRPGGRECIACRRVRKASST